MYLKLRHLSGSYFKDGNGKVYRQPLGSWRTFEFNRFSVTNTVKCNQEEKKGNSEYLSHMIWISCLTPLLARKGLLLPLEVLQGNLAKFFVVCFCLVFWGLNMHKNLAKYKRYMCSYNGLVLLLRHSTENLSAKNYRCFRVDHGGNKPIDSVHLSIK